MKKHFKQVSLLLLSATLLSTGSIEAKRVLAPSMEIAQQKGGVTGVITDQLGPIAGATVEDDRDNGILQNKENTPVRLMYSSNEASMNTDNYNAQSKDNDPHVRLWWDVK